MSYSRFTALLAEVFRHWAAKCSAFIGAIGTVRDMTGWPAIIPSWLPWMLAFAALAYAYISHVAQSQKKIRDLEGARHDMSLNDVVAHILGPTNDNTPELAQKYHDALADVREKANLGYVKTWGRNGLFLGSNPSGPLHEIPQAHWSNYSLDYLEYMVGNNQKGRLGPPNNHDKTYEDIWFNRTQVEVAWPKKKTKSFTFQWPLKKL